MAPTPDRPPNLPPRDGRGRWVRTEAGRERDTLALEMKSHGRTYQEIADALGYNDRSDAHEGVRRALAEVPAPRVNEARQRMLEEVDVIKRRVWEFLENNLIKPAEDGEPLEVDYQASLKAAAELNKLLATERALLGLDAPTKTEVDVKSVRFTIAGLDPEDI